MTTLNVINEFMSQKNIAVAGVSRSKSKFGNAIYNELSKKGYHVYPVNPNMKEFEGNKCYDKISELPQDVTGLVISTKPEVTKTLLREAESKGIKWIWLQQGSADKETISSFENHPGVISKQCILMFAEPVKGIHGFHKWVKKTFHKLPQ
jgi:uncharacterized protein